MSVHREVIANPVEPARKTLKMSVTFAEVDFIEEIRLRCWARENYTSRENRDSTWHRVILDEMRVRDLELLAESDETETVFENLST